MNAHDENGQALGGTDAEQKIHVAGRGGAGRGGRRRDGRAAAGAAVRSWGRARRPRRPTTAAISHFRYRNRLVEIRESGPLVMASVDGRMVHVERSAAGVIPQSYAAVPDFHRPRERCCPDADRHGLLSNWSSCDQHAGASPRGRRSEHWAELLDRPPLASWPALTRAARPARRHPPATPGTELPAESAKSAHLQREIGLADAARSQSADRADHRQTRGPLSTSATGSARSAGARAGQLPAGGRYSVGRRCRTSSS